MTKRLSGWAAVAISCLLYPATTSAEHVAQPSTGAEEALKPHPIGSPGAWFGDIAYPPDAVRAHAQGRTLVELGIDSDGVVVRCKVKESSHSVALDGTVCSLAKSRGRFTPAHDGVGRPIASTYLFPVSWKLEDGNTPTEVSDQPVRLEQNTVEMTVDAKGKIVDCRVLAETFPFANLCIGQIGKPSGKHFTSDGKPVEAKFKITVTLEAVRLTAATIKPR